MTRLDLLEALARDTSPGGREVFQDAVRELSPSELDSVLFALARRMREGTAQAAATAVISASRIFGAFGVPSAPARILNLSRLVLRTGHVYDEKPRQAYIPGPYPWVAGRSIETTYDPTRSSFKIEADRVERFAGAIHWVEGISRAIYDDPSPAFGELRVYKNGRVVGRSRNLRGVAAYARRAEGSDLIVLQKAAQEPPSTSPYPAGLLHIRFQDGATLTTKFGSYDMMERWIANKIRNRTSWLAGTPIMRLDASGSASRDPRACSRPRRTRRAR